MEYGSAGDSREAIEFRLGNLEGATVLFTRDAAHVLSSCTATETRACHITHHLPVLNSYFSRVKLEIRERRRRATELAVISNYCPGLMTLTSEDAQQIPKIFRLLLTAHHCVTKLDISVKRPHLYNVILCDALRDSKSITKIKLHNSVIEDMDPRYTFCTSILSLKNLEHLECSIDSECGLASLYMLSTILRSSNRLSSLYIPFLTMKRDEAKMILMTITSCNSPLKALSLNSEVLRQAPVNCIADFADYLKHRTSLATLIIAGLTLSSGAATKMVLEAISANKTINRLEFRLASIDHGLIDLVGRIVEKNVALNILHILPPCRYSSTRLVCPDIWFQALRTNETLREMTLPLHIMAPQYWAVFFRLLSKNVNLTSVTLVGSIPDGFDLEDVCQALQDSGVEGKVTFGSGLGSHFYRANCALLNCRAFVHVVASSNNAYSDEPLSILVRHLCSLSHVTSLTLHIDPYADNEDLSSALVDYIGTTVTLKTLRVNTGLRFVSRKDANISWTVIIDSLGRNQSITELSLQTRCIEQGEVEQLADVINGSHNIRRITVWQCECSNIFLKRLATNIADNYSLLSANIKFPFNGGPDSCAVWNTTRRNSSFVARACRFRRGAELDRLIAGALERVSRHRALLAEFAHVESITEEEARATLEGGLMTFDDIDSFMRLAGVVKDSVTCYPPEDGRRQLDQLNEYCWRVIRQYLMLDDVKEGCAQLSSDLKPC